MKPSFLLLYLLFIMVTGYSQSKKELSANEPISTHNQKNKTDHSIPVEYLTKKKNQDNVQIAYFVNNTFAEDLSAVSPNEIESIQVVKRDTTVNGHFYPNRIMISLKKGYALHPVKKITLNELKRDYTHLNGKPALFTIDGKLINADYDFYKVNESHISKIQIEKLIPVSSSNPIWLIHILTTLSEKKSLSHQIMMRGSSAMAQK